MSKKTIILISFIIAKFLLQYLVISPEYELHRDEFLHLDQAHHLAWGFLSVPPLTSWISCIIVFLGESVFWVRFFPALFGAMTIVVVWKAIEELKGNLFEPIRELLGDPIKINSGYRCEKLNVAVRGVDTSQHVKAEALDMLPTMNIQDAFHKIVQSSLIWDQLILEHDSGGHTWIHASIKKGANRQQVIASLLKKT